MFIIVGDEYLFHHQFFDFSFVDLEAVPLASVHKALNLYSLSSSFEMRPATAKSSDHFYRYQCGELYFKSAVYRAKRYGARTIFR